MGKTNIKQVSEAIEKNMPIEGTFLTPIRRVEKDSKKNMVVLFRCICGKEVEKFWSNVYHSKHTTHCSYDCPLYTKKPNWYNDRCKHLYDEINKLKKCNELHCDRKDQWLPLTEFGASPHGLGGVVSKCKKCVLLILRAGKYGFESLGDMLSFYEEKNYKCEICERPVPIINRNKKHKSAIDHDHDSGKVRGLLCDLCNIMLGAAKDNMKTLESAINYLKKHKGE